MKKVELYTDGACKGNPGPGGYGAILVYGGAEKEFSGGEALTTNNRMELLGAITGLAALKEPCEADLGLEVPCGCRQQKMGGRLAQKGLEKGRRQARAQH